MIQRAANLISDISADEARRAAGTASLTNAGRRALQLKSLFCQIALASLAWHAVWSIHA